MTPGELKDRTKKFALAIMKLGERLPRSKVSEIIFGQLLRAGTSVGANYHEAYELTAIFASSRKTVRDNR